jgi:hypothetical protein
MSIEFEVDGLGRRFDVSGGKWRLAYHQWQVPLGWVEGVG